MYHKIKLNIQIAAKNFEKIEQITRIVFIALLNILIFDTSRSHAKLNFLQQIILDFGFKITVGECDQISLRLFVLNLLKFEIFKISVKIRKLALRCIV